MKLFATSAFAVALLNLPSASATLLLDDDQQQLLAQQDASLWLGVDGVPEEYSLLSQIDNAIEVSATSVDRPTENKEHVKEARDEWMQARDN